MEIINTHFNRAILKPTLRRRWRVALLRIPIVLCPLTETPENMTARE